MDIDAVITWVDGADPAHRNRLDAVLASIGQSRRASAERTRFNDAGVIGYRAGLGSGYGLASTGAGSSLLHVVDANVLPGPYAYIYTPAMNSSRLIACKVSIGDFNHNEIRSFASDGSCTTLAVDTATNPASPYRRFDNGLAYNDAGQVAVVLNLDAGDIRAVYRFTPTGGGVDAVEIARVEATGTIRDIESFAPAINAGGLVVFRGRDANGQHIDDPTAWPIFSGAASVNEHGDIAFIGALHPAGDTQIEWGTGVFVAYAGDDPIFSDSFDGP